MVLDVFYVSSSFHSVSSCTLCFTEALEVYDLARTQEFDDITHVRIVGKAQDIVVRHARFLLCCDFVRTTFVFQQIQPCISAKLLTATFQKRVFPDFVLQGSEEFGQASPT